MDTKSEATVYKTPKEPFLKRPEYFEHKNVDQNYRNNKMHEVFPKDVYRINRDDLHANKNLVKKEAG